MDRSRILKKEEINCKIKLGPINWKIKKEKIFAQRNINPVNH
jgi:hypothetical protein